jgi:hypothetical protein
MWTLFYMNIILFIDYQNLLGQDIIVCWCAMSL